jgi:hypothetical protein
MFILRNTKTNEIKYINPQDFSQFTLKKTSTKNIVSVQSIHSEGSE